MKIIDGSTFQVATHEAIAVEIRKTVAPFQASISDLTGAPWSPKPSAAALVASGGFTAPAAAGSIVLFTVLFDFTPQHDGSYPPGDQYSVIIHGRPGEDTRTQTIFPPPLSNRSYLFRVA